MGHKEEEGGSKPSKTILKHNSTRFQEALRGYKTKITHKIDTFTTIHNGGDKGGGIRPFQQKVIWFLLTHQTQTPTPRTGKQKNLGATTKSNTQHQRKDPPEEVLKGPHSEQNIWAGRGHRPQPRFPGETRSFLRGYGLVSFFDKVAGTGKFFSGSKGNPTPCPKHPTKTADKGTTPPGGPGKKKMEKNSRTNNHPLVR